DVSGGSVPIRRDQPSHSIQARVQEIDALGSWRSFAYLLTYFSLEVNALPPKRLQISIFIICSVEKILTSLVINLLTLKPRRNWKLESHLFVAINTTREVY